MVSGRPLLSASDCMVTPSNTCAGSKKHNMNSRAPGDYIPKEDKKKEGLPAGLGSEAKASSVMFRSGIGPKVPFLFLGLGDGRCARGWQQGVNLSTRSQCSRLPSPRPRDGKDHLSQQGHDKACLGNQVQSPSGDSRMGDVCREGLWFPGVWSVSQGPNHSCFDL